MNSIETLLPIGAQWQLELPCYTKGNLDPILYHCGYCLYEGQSASRMHLITDTTASDFSEWCDRVIGMGFEKIYTNAIDDNLYAGFRSNNGKRYYAYYRSKLGSGVGEVRVILESADSAPLEAFGYTLSGSDDTAFYLFNLNSSNEDTYLIRTADRHWILIDGGVSMYSDLVDPDGLFGDAIYEFIRDHGVGEGEKPVISCWYLTHAHRDHFLGFQALLSRRADDIVLERVIANLPDAQSVTHNSNMADFRKFVSILQEKFPNVPYLKAHEGMKIPLADVTITVLGTQENLLPFWVSNRDAYYNFWRHYRTVGADHPNYGEYRTSCKLYDINNSSIVSMIDVNGMTVLETGDLYRNEWLFPYFKEETLVSDVLKTAHHFINVELALDYCKLCRNRRIKYVLANCRTFMNSSNETSLKEVLESDQHLIQANSTTIYAFQRQACGVKMHTIPATYSWFQHLK